MSDPKQDPKPPAPGRIPLNRIWLNTMIDLPNGNSITQSIDCSPQKVEGRQFFVAHFVPAHQVIELECYKNEKCEPYRTRLSMSLVQRTD